MPPFCAEVQAVLSRCMNHAQATMHKYFQIADDRRRLISINAQVASRSYQTGLIVFQSKLTENNDEHLECCA
jgi:hypothetical protein